MMPYSARTVALYGIDLGTTFASVAVADRGVARMVPLEDRGVTLATAVLLDGTVPGSPSATVGRRAVAQWRERCGSGGGAPAGLALVRGSKSHLGVEHAVAGGPPWPLDGIELRATDLGALVLRSLRAWIDRTPGLPPLDGVVVTHPQRLRNRERRAVAQSVALADLRCAALLPEPDAAAWAYGMGPRFAGRSARFMVFDFGGGTLDVTILRRTGGAQPSLEAMASYGAQLGGLGVDERVREHLVDRYRSAAGVSGVTLADLDEASREGLLAAAEGIKIQLNRHASDDANPAVRVASRTVALRTVTGDGLPSAALRVSLGEFARWTDDVTARAASCADEALHRAGLRWGDLDEVLLVGGSSWLHPVQVRLREACGAVPVRLFDDDADPLNPACAVAAGAALYAEHLARDASVTSYQGVIPDALGVRAREPDPDRPGARRDTLAVLVPPLTRVPFEGRRTFRKRGGATTLPIEVLEGSSLADATPLGRFDITLDEGLADGAPVEVVLRIARDGIFSLALHDPATQRTRTVSLRDARGLYADDELEARRTWLCALRLDPGG